jgi:hypothetical protein
MIQLPEFEFNTHPNSIQVGLRLTSEFFVKRFIFLNFQLTYKHRKIILISIETIIALGPN